MLVNRHFLLGENPVIRILLHFGSLDVYKIFYVALIIYIKVLSWGNIQMASLGTVPKPVLYIACYFLKP